MPEHTFLHEKKILLCITGGIAAYKCISLLRTMTAAGAEVKVILTEEASQFVSKVTLAALSGHPVYSSFYEKDNGSWHNHVDMALWADAILIAPCTANTLAKLSCGICDSLLTAVYFSAKCPVAIAPAMDLDMYAHPTVKKNTASLESYGNSVIPAAYGKLASGLTGLGRLADEETILHYLKKALRGEENNFWKGKKILITAGPTYEAIDPVRFIGNHSSGKMGYALAEKAASLGAEVCLVSGPTALTTTHPDIRCIKVTGALEMYDACMKEFPQCDVAIASAAVADYRPESIHSEKIKKSGDTLTVTLVKNPDILKKMGEMKTTQTLVGFALETENALENAREKRIRKNADFVVLNSLKDEGAGFGTDTNKITLLSADGEKSFPLMSKKELAAEIFGALQEYMSGK